MKDKISNLPCELRQGLETKIVDLGQCIENSCENVTTKALLNNIEKNISEMNSKVSKLTSDITKTTEQPTKNINLILQGWNEILQSKTRLDVISDIRFQKSMN